MAYTPPHVFSTGTGLAADELTANNAAAYDYLNAGITAADLTAGSFDTQDLQAGYAVVITEDVRLTTGDVYSHRHDGIRDTMQRRYITGTIKTSSITDTAVYVSIPGAGREIFLESPADLIIEAAGTAIVLESENYAYKNATTPTPVKVDSRFYVEVDGIIRPDSVCYAFTEDGGAPSSQSVASGDDLGSGASARRPLYIYWSEANLSAGYHTIRLVCDPRAERIFVAMLSLQIEAFNDGGYTSYTGSAL